MPGRVYSSGFVRVWLAVYLEFSGQHFCVCVVYDCQEWRGMVPLIYSNCKPGGR